MSKTWEETLKEPKTFSDFGVVYFQSAAENQGFSGEGLCKHFLE